MALLENFVLIGEILDLLVEVLIVALVELQGRLHGFDLSVETGYIDEICALIGQQVSG